MIGEAWPGSGGGGGAGGVGAGWAMADAAANREQDRRSEIMRIEETPPDKKIGRDIKALQDDDNAALPPFVESRSIDGGGKASLAS